MSTEEKKPADPGAAETTAASATPAKTGAKKGVALGGGVVGLISLAWALALVAVPGKSHHEQEHRIAGPFMADISPSAGFQVNLSGDGGKHYLSLKLNVEVDAFEEAYVSARAAQPLYQAKLTDAVLRTASQKTKGELDNAVGREVFRDELRLALDPVLFPVHVGDAHSPDGAHEESGLRFGRSISKANLRGLFYEHELQVDAPRKSVRLDDGKDIVIQGDETDLFVSDSHGKGVYVDVTGLHPDFVGAVPTGTFGRVRDVYWGNFLTQ